MIDSGIAGLILAAAYMISGRVLWVTILAHRFIGTIAVTALYFGWASQAASGLDDTRPQSPFPPLNVYPVRPVAFMPAITMIAVSSLS